MWILTASLTCLSRLVLQLFTTLKLNSGLPPDAPACGSQPSLPLHHASAHLLAQQLTLNSLLHIGWGTLLCLPVLTCQQPFWSQVDCSWSIHSHIQYSSSYRALFSHQVVHTSYMLLSRRLLHSMDLCWRGVSSTGCLPSLLLLF